MARLPLTIRDAVPSDADDIVTMWAACGAGIGSPGSVSDAGMAIGRIEASSLERLVVGELEGQLVGVIHLRRGHLSPLHTQEVIHTSFLLVLPEHRRHGFARTLLDVGLTWAEELGLDYITALTQAVSRDANRFLARLGLASAATLRIAPTALLRAKLSPTSRTGRVSPSRVLAQRRSMRRRESVR